LLECEFDPAQESFAAGCLAGGRRQPGDDVTAARQLDSVRKIGCHDEIGIAISDLRLEAGEKLLFAAIPCDNDLYARQLSAVVIIVNKDL